MSAKKKTQLAAGAGGRSAPAHEKTQLAAGAGGRSAPAHEKTQLAAGAGGRSAPALEKSGPSVQDEKLYSQLRSEGASKQKAAGIANASAAQGRSSVGQQGGSAGSYDDWTVEELRKRAKELGLSGYSGKKKSALVAMLRNT